METTLIITDITRMNHGNVCVAGVNREGKTIRPLFEYRGIPEDWLYENGKCVVQPFTEITLDLVKHHPQPPHTEDWIMDDKKISCMATPDMRKRRDLLQKICDKSVSAIFNTEIHDDHGHYTPAGEGERSMGTIFVRYLRAFKHRCYQGMWDYRIGFDDFASGTYWLKINDLTFRYYIDYLREQEQIDCNEIEKRLTTLLRQRDVFLRIGLARRWKDNLDRCYLQITGIYSFPDYLEGKCHADYRPQPNAQPFEDTAEPPF